jgi:proteasome lid subunit RPN8/RPN11
MIAQAVAELPNECCGLLAGNIHAEAAGVPLAIAEQRYPLINEAASPTEYLSEPNSMFQAVRDMRLSGTEILAIYHSHPSSEPIPSKRDLAQSYAGDVANLIISLAGSRPIMAAWWLTSDGFKEAVWETR